jgi:hypothetical protein
MLLMPTRMSGLKRACVRSHPINRHDPITACRRPHERRRSDQSPEPQPHPSHLDRQPLGRAITIVAGMIWSDMDQSPTSVSQLPVTVLMHKDSMRLLHACHDEDQEKLTPCQFVSWDLTAKIL